MTCQVLTCVQVPGAPTFPFPSSRLRERRDAWTRFCFGGEEGDEVVDDDAQADDQELTGVCLRHFREEDLLRRQDGGKQEEKYGKLMRAIKKVFRYSTMSSTKVTDILTVKPSYIAVPFVTELGKESVCKKCS